MGQEEEEEGREIEGQLELQLQEQRDSLSAVEQALASDPSNSDLLEVSLFTYRQLFIHLTPQYFTFLFVLFNYQIIVRTRDFLVILSIYIYIYRERERERGELVCNLIDNCFATVLFPCILTPKSPCSSLSKMKVYELWTCFKVDILDILIALEVTSASLISTSDSTEQISGYMRCKVIT